jgi:hypothetical protein
MTATKFSQRRKLSLLKLLIAFLLINGFFVAGAQSQDLAGFEKNIILLGEKYPAGMIQSKEVADHAILEAEEALATMQKLWSSNEQLCYDKFFTTKCIDDLRLTRRKIQETLKRIQVEGKSFLRKERVAKNTANS